MLALCQVACITAHVYFAVSNYLLTVITANAQEHLLIGFILLPKIYIALYSVNIQCELNQELMY